MVLEEAAYRTGDEHATALAGAALENTNAALASTRAAAYRVSRALLRFIVPRFMVRGVVVVRSCGVHDMGWCLDLAFVLATLAELAQQFEGHRAAYRSQREETQSAQRERGEVGA